MFTFLERYLSRMSGKSMPVDLDHVKPFMGFCTAIIYMGVSQNEAAGTGSLSQGSVSRVCFVVCFGGLFRTVLLPRTVKFKGSVSGSVSKVCFGVCFGGLFRQSRTSQPYLKLHSPKKCKPIYVCVFDCRWIYCTLVCRTKIPCVSSSTYRQCSHQY